MVVPALFLLWTSFIQPLQTMLAWSFQRVTGLTTDKAEFIGSVNFERLLNDPLFAKALTVTLLLIGGRVLVVAIVPPLLGWTLSRFGRGLRFTLRLFLMLPLVFFSPIITYLSWQLTFNPASGLFPNQAVLADAKQALGTLQQIDFLSSFGIACALGVIAYVMAFRPLGGTGARRGTRRGFFALWLTSLALAVTTTLQSSAALLLLTNGGPINTTLTLPLWFNRTAFVQFQFGLASALGVVLLGVIAVFGMIVGLYLIFSNVALIDVRPHRFKVLGRSVAFLILAFVFTAVLLAILVNLLPVLWVYLTGQNGSLPLPKDISLMQIILNTIQPSLLQLVLRLPLVYLAALGIGALRPLGRYSGLLLIPFTPFLFMTIYLLSPAWFNTLRTEGLVNTPQAIGTAAGLLNVGALFILTLYFKGQTALWDRENYPGLGGFLRVVILPSLPLFIAIFLGAAAIAVQDADWTYIVSTTPSNYTIWQWIMNTRNQYSANLDSIRALLTQVGMIFNMVYFVGLVLASAFYVDRLALGTPPALRDALARIDPPPNELQ
jgi:ABC-type sugar transport system permease subunit